MKRYRITLEGQTFDVKVLDDPRREQVQVEVNGETFVVGVEAVPVMTEATVDDERPTGKAAASPTTPTPAPGGAAMAGAGQTVTAPLPGVVKSIAVRPGQQVAPDDKLLIIEAMKMDNVIRAARGGTIGTIYVAEGRQVAYGEAMLDLAD
jgi:biotin carboxyl carrier protein